MKKWKLEHRANWRDGQTYWLVLEDIERFYVIAEVNAGTVQSGFDAQSIVHDHNEALAKPTGGTE